MTHGETSAASRPSLDVSTDDLEERLARMLEKITDSPPRPAAAKLAYDQARVLVAVLEGFHSRADLLDWMQDLTIHSLGALPDDWYAEVAADSAMVSALLGRPWGTLSQSDHDDLPPEFADEVRRGLVVEDLLPAFRTAHREFRWSAGERVEFLDDETDDAPRVDPTEQSYPAMRPSLGHLRDRTEWALESLLAGFDDETEVLIWVQTVTAAVHAEVDEATVKGAYFQRPIREAMLGNAENAAWVREAWAAEYLLPAFNRATAEVADRAGEVISGESAGNQDPLDWS